MSQSHGLWPWSITLSRIPAQLTTVLERPLQCLGGNILSTRPQGCCRRQRASVPTKHVRSGANARTLAHKCLWFVEFEGILCSRDAQIQSGMDFADSWTRYGRHDPKNGTVTVCSTGANWLCDECVLMRAKFRRSEHEHFRLHFHMFCRKEDASVEARRRCSRV